MLGYPRPFALNGVGAVRLHVACALAAVLACLCGLAAVCSLSSEILKCGVRTYTLNLSCLLL